MCNSRRVACSVLALALLLGAAAVGAQTLAVGSRIEGFSLRDQHGQAHEVRADTRAILFIRGMKAGGVGKAALEDSQGGLLAQAGAVYIADVSPMPALIRRVIAIPRMRRRGYPILLDRDGSQTASFPSVEDSATLLVLDRLRIQQVLHLDSPAEIKAALENAASAEEPGEITD
ncbi:MAG: FAD/FMN-containing dehydrogenase [Myxococcota bacterium]